MSAQKLFLIVASAALGVLSSAVAAVGLGWAGEPVATASGGINRLSDPVIVKGAGLAVFDGVSLQELVLYRKGPGSWEPIAFQIDEVTAGGEYTTTEDGLLDADDQLVFLGRDGGGAASQGDWVDNAEARLNPRYAITVTDPLAPGDHAHVYLYRSATLPRSAVSYVAFDEPRQYVTAVSYTLSFSPTKFIGISDMTINGHPVDILDRQKLRSKVSGLLNQTLTEEGLVQYAGVQSITLPIVGPVRAVSSGGTEWFAFYAGRIDVVQALLLSEMTPPASRIDWTRVSFDWNDPVACGMAPATYYDSNTPDGVPIDGVADVVSTTPAISWYQVSGSLGGAAFVLDVDAGEDVLSDYYKDDSSVDSSDTGDKKSFADTGIRVDKSGDSLGNLYVTQTTYILPPGPGVMGAQARQWLDAPLVASVAVEQLDLSGSFLPLVLRE